MHSIIQVHVAKGKPQSSPVVAIWASRAPRHVVAGAAQARRAALAVRAPGVTMTATMRHALVSRLSTDSLPPRTPMGRGGDAQREH